MTRNPPDPLAEQFITLIRDELSKRGITIKEFAELLGVTRQSVSEVLNKPSRVQSNTMFTYCRALDLAVTLEVKDVRKRTKPKG